MKSTGKYWIPIFSILENSCNVTITHTKYILKLLVVKIVLILNFIMMPSKNKKLKSNNAIKFLESQDYKVS